MRKHAYVRTLGRVGIAALLACTVAISPNAVAADVAPVDQLAMELAVASVEDESVVEEPVVVTEEPVVENEEPAAVDAEPVAEEVAAPEREGSSEPIVEESGDDVVPEPEPSEQPSEPVVDEEPVRESSGPEDVVTPAPEEPAEDDAIQDEPAPEQPGEAVVMDEEEEPAPDTAGTGEVIAPAGRTVQPMAAGPDGGDPPYVYWRVTDANGAPVGGASFTLQGPRTFWGWGSSVTVDDCVQAPCTGLDLDPDPGEFLVKQIRSSGLFPSTHNISESNRYRLQQSAAPSGHAFVAGNDWIEIPGSGNTPSGWQNQTYDFGQFSLAEDPAQWAHLTVRTGGDRVDTTTTVTGLEGATFEFFRVSNSSALSGGTSVGTCTTASSGECTLEVPLNSGSNYFYVTQTAAPAGWEAAGYWGTTSEHIRYNSGAITRGGAAATRMVTLPGGDRTFPTIRHNREVLDKCGLNIALVYDLSNSVTDSTQLMTQYKNAGKGFVDALVGTPSSIAVYTFATDAPAAGTANTNLGLTSVASSGEVVKNKIDGLTKTPQTNQGGTNWDMGLAAVDADKYDAVIFLTDGDPTFARYPTVGTGSSTNLQMVEEAIHSANKVKASSSLMVVGIGGSVNTSAGQKRLSLLSSDFHTTGFADLEQFLREMALKSCLGTLTVVKEVQAPSGAKSPGAGWTFATNTAGVTPGSAVTDANGALNFEVDGYNANVTSRDVTVVEEHRPGYVLQQQNGANAVCTNTANNQPVAAANSGALGFTVPVPRDGAISCKVTNQQLPTLTLQKRWIDGITGDTTELTIGGAVTAGPALSTVGDTPTFLDTDNTVSAIVEPGETVSVSESLAVDRYSAALTCQGVESDYAAGALSGSFAMPSNDVTCTFDNTRVKAHLTLVKEVENSFGGTSTAGDFVLTATPTEGAALSFHSGDRQEIAPGKYTIGEEPLDGYEFQGLACRDGQTDLTLDGMSLDVQNAQDVICTLTNSDLPGAVEWTKVDADDDQLLAGSVWSVQGPGPDGPTVTVEDCVAASPDECDGPDMDPGAGSFRLGELSWGRYVLTETTAPVGYEPGEAREFEVTAENAGSSMSIGAIENERILGSVSWTKVAAGGSDPLGGSEWQLSGPGGLELTITDCADECDGVDRDPETGAFLVEDLPWGSYELRETAAPAGYYPRLDSITFAIGPGEPAALAWELDPVENTPITGPPLPLTGGISRDFFLIMGLSTLILGLAAAAIARRTRSKGVADL